MAEFMKDDVRIQYEDVGTGTPLFLLAPGGLNSRIERWPNASINPLERYNNEFRLIAMDQRNAGKSVGPLDGEHPWDTYVDDQIALLDHLKIDSFLVMGCCIGCSYALKIAERLPERVLAAVLQQPIGIVDENRDLWMNESREWVQGLRERRDDIDESTAEAFCQQMWNTSDFVGSVTRQFTRQCSTAMLVLPGINQMHPTEIGREIAALAPKATLIEPWKDTEADVEIAATKVRSFLHEHEKVASRQGQRFPAGSETESTPLGHFR